jgi:hypothetical protein
MILHTKDFFEAVVVFWVNDRCAKKASSIASDMKSDSINSRFQNILDRHS